MPPGDPALCALGALAARSRVQPAAVRYVKAGAVIIRQGEKPDNVYFVLEGRCEVTKDIVLKAENRWPTGAKNWTVKVCTAVRPFKVLELGPGSYFGEKAIIEDALRAATVTAATDCTLLSLDKLAFLELLNRGHSLENVYSKTQGYPSDEDVLALFSGLVDGKQSGKAPAAAPGSAPPPSAGSAAPGACLLYTSPGPRDGLLSRMPSSA